MSYKQAAQVLPPELLREVQAYVDGEFIYVPRREGRRRSWGEATATREELKARDERIYQEFQRGECAQALAERYYLSVKTIQRIVRRERAEREDDE